MKLKWILSHAESFVRSTRVIQWIKRWKCTTTKQMVVRLFAGMAFVFTSIRVWHFLNNIESFSKNIYKNNKRTRIFACKITGWLESIYCVFQRKTRVQKMCCVVYLRPVIKLCERSFKNCGNKSFSLFLFTLFATGKKTVDGRIALRVGWERNLHQWK